jgi:hypothetical protein
VGLDVDRPFAAGPEVRSADAGAVAGVYVDGGAGAGGGVGINVAAFSFFNVVMLRLLPIRDPETIVQLQRRSPEASTNVMSYPQMAFYRDHADAAPVAVLSYKFWQRRFGSDPSVVGRTIRLNKKVVTVVGVTADDFVALASEHPDVWLPISQIPYFVEGSKALTDASAGTVEMWGRLAPGVTATMAEQELLALTNEYRKLYPKGVG